MINIQNYRRDVNDRRHTPSSLGESMGAFSRTTGAALAAMIQYELGYGGRVESLDVEHQGLSRIVVKTSVMSKVDTVIYIGTQAALMPFLEYIHCYSSVNGDPGEEFGQIYEELKGTDMGNKLLRPLYLVHAGPLLVGQSRATRGLIAYLSDEEQDILRLRQYDFHSLLEALVLKIDRDETIEQQRQRMP